MRELILLIIFVTRLSNVWNYEAFKKNTTILNIDQNKDQQKDRYSLILKFITTISILNFSLCLLTGSTGIST